MTGGTFLVGAKKGFTDSGENFAKKISVPERVPDVVEEQVFTIKLKFIV